jgi:anti-sigma B factor antagonist
MRLKQKKSEDVTICYIEGEVNIDAVEGLKDSFRKLLDSGIRKVLLNCCKLDYIDSAGLACLIEFYKNLKDKQGVLFISDLSPKVRSVFAITKLENAFKIFDTQDQALQEFYGY